jgi:hypothetical protein
MTNVKWRKSSYSSNGEDTCVEVARVPENKRIAARDSKQPKGPQLRFDTNEWRAFVDAVKLGTHDLSN